MQMNKLISYRRWGVLLVLVAAVSGLAGYFLGRNATEQPRAADAGARNLPIRVTVDEEAGITAIPTEQLGNANGNLSYLGVSQVAIDIAGTSMDLEDALRQGDISTEEMVA